MEGICSIRNIPLSVFPSRCCVSVRFLRFLLLFFLLFLFFRVGDSNIFQLAVAVQLGNVAGRIGYGISFRALCLTDLILHKIARIIPQREVRKACAPSVGCTQRSPGNCFFFVSDDLIECYLYGFAGMRGIAVRIFLCDIQCTFSRTLSYVLSPSVDVLKQRHAVRVRLKWGGMQAISPRVFYYGVHVFCISHWFTCTQTIRKVQNSPVQYVISILKDRSAGVLHRICLRSVIHFSILSA